MLTLQPAPVLYCAKAKHLGLFYEDAQLNMPGGPGRSRRTFFCEGCGSKLEPSLRYAIVGMVEYPHRLPELITPDVAQKAIALYHEIHNITPKEGEGREQFMARVLTTLRDNDGILKIE